MRLIFSLVFSLTAMAMKTFEEERLAIQRLGLKIRATC